LVKKVIGSLEDLPEENGIENPQILLNELNRHIKKSGESSETSK